MGKYEVTGTGHHPIPVELWDKFGFHEDVYEFLDGYRLIDAKTHNYLGHGPCTGYTGFLSAELTERLTKFLSKNPEKKLNVLEQIEFLKQFIDDIHAGKVKRTFIFEFNEAARKKGITGVQKFLDEDRAKFPKYADIPTPIRILGTRPIPISKAKTIVTFLGDSTRFISKKWLPVISFILTYREANANGNHPIGSVMIGLFEEVNVLPIGYTEFHAAGEKVDETYEWTKEQRDVYRDRIFDILRGGTIPSTAGDVKTPFNDRPRP